MSTANLPVNIFKLAAVRAPRKPLVAEDDARRIPYTMDSAFYSALQADRVGADPRPDMIASAQGFVDSAPLYIPDLAALKALFPGFEHLDDYLRTHLKNAVKADLKDLLEGPLVLDEPAADYVTDAGYEDLKSRVWDNVFALTVLGTITPLRTEEVRILRLLNVIEKIADDDTLLDTGPGILSAYLSTVLLPGDVFPMPDVPLPEEPETRPADLDPIPALEAELNALREAYREIREAYALQVYRYKALRYPPRKEEDDDDGLQPNPIQHDPLVLYR